MTAGVTVGVLALQGDVREHVRTLRGLDVDTRLVRRPAELDAVDALILPGGESSTIDKLSRVFGMRDPLRAAIADGMPVYGTCAGLIMLADRILDAAPGQQSLGGMDITVRRNAFGSQTDSFETELRIDAFGAPAVHAAFIRAPEVVETGPGVEVLAALPDGRIVAVRQGGLLATSFHPEVTGETRFHRLLVDAAAARAAHAPRTRRPSDTERPG